MAGAALHLGAFGDDVARLHQALAQRGFVVSGDERKRRFFGPSTRDALLEFQKRQGLDATGALDAKTVAALAAPLPPGPAALRAARPLIPAPQAAAAPSSRVAAAAGAVSAGSAVGVLSPAPAPPRAGAVLGGIDLSNIQ